MSELLPVTAAEPPLPAVEAFDWLGRVLTQFATGERAIGQFCLALDMPVEKGPLSSLQSVCHRLAHNPYKRCQALLRRIERWRSMRPLRHLLAHATVMVVHDSAGKRFILTRHLPLDRHDVTPDRLWTEDECRELLRVATNDGRSIADQVRNLMQSAAIMVALKQPASSATPPPNKAPCTG
ncbi:MAG: hypothetical protein KAF27_10715 [Porphyrobacter sp.]|nr:hypothetical protein [Porphyrobacter sp.]